MRLSDYDFDLPPERIARHPAPERDASRLFVLHRDGRPDEHTRFAALPGLLRPGDLLILNDTRVLPARLRGRRADTGGAVELLLLRPESDGQRWQALVRPGRRLRPGVVVDVGTPPDTARVSIDAVAEDGARIVAFAPDADVAAFLERQGEMPLPPYMEREATPEDRIRYQTVYARAPGAVAAPTAGLHLTTGLLAALNEHGVAHATVTLHVGPGTFRPVTSPDPREHRMDAEWYEVPESTARAFAACRAAGGRIVACGTTVVRTLESAAGGGFGGSAGGVERVATLAAGPGWTRAFLYPPYGFRAVDALVTNFHLPRSTLLMLVAALAGRERILAAYTEAVARGYRFYSYGDAMLID